MRIQNVQISDYNRQRKTAFKGIVRDVYTQSKRNPFVMELKHRNTSFMFRPSLKYCIKLYDYLSNIFADTNKVNVYNYGCSLGYEAYCFIIGMFTGNKPNSEKFMPVIAKDYDEKIIEEAKTYKIPLDYYERDLVRVIANKKNIDEFIKTIEFQNYDQDLSGYPSKKLRDNVIFPVADIRSDYKNIKPNNSFIMAANFWPYIDKEERAELAQNLHNQLGENSYIKIDKFDNEQNALNDHVTTSEHLLNAGFQETPIENLFKSR